MYEKIIRLLVFIWILIGVIACTSCRTAMVSNLGERDRDYRNAQSEVRTGQEDIGNASREIERTSERIEESINELEAIIRTTEEPNSNIREILQRIRNRKVADNNSIDIREDNIVETEE